LVSSRASSAKLTTCQDRVSTPCLYANMHFGL
jgi:hypothetical protein